MKKLLSTKEVAEFLNVNEKMVYTRQNGSRQKQIAHLGENVRLVHLKAGTKGETNKLALYGHLDEFFKELEEFRTRESIHYDLVHSHYWLSARVGMWAQERWEVRMLT